MRTAMVIMTILGCDDGTVDCHYIATINQRWTSVALCNAVSEKELAAFTNVSYPTVMAVCQDTTVAATDTKAPASSPAAPVLSAEQEREEEQTFARRALDRAKSVIPTMDGMRDIVSKPVHLVEDGYAWVIRKLR